MAELVTPELSTPPQGCYERLTNHYGPGVAAWITAMPEVLTSLARQWGYAPTAYHDAGHASVLVLATSPEGRRVLLKAWPDSDRCARESTALRLWSALPTARVLALDRERSVAALSLIGGRPGGGRRRADDLPRMVRLIQRTHQQGRAAAEDPAFPTLASYLEGQVRPRIAERMEKLDLSGYRTLLQDGLRALEALRHVPGRSTLLHSDLYQENTVCDQNGEPHLIDPLAMVGDAAFDWAFWIVYYTLGQRTSKRLALAAQESGIRVQELRSWCAAMCLDGLLYYLDVHDPRVDVMAQTMTQLCHSTEGAG